jgi:TIR domain
MFRIGKPPGRIFINYRRDDVIGVAGRLGDSLNRYFGDGRVFRDVEGIAAGANFEDVLRHTAEQADAMIVLIGPRWLSSVDAQGRPRLHDPQDWVAREIASALERGIPVYPVLIEHAQMPRAEELPELLRPLVRHNALALSDQRWSADVMRLAKVVAIDIPGSAAQRTLQWVQWAISLALWLSVSLTAGWVAWQVTHGVAQPLVLWQSGVTYVVVVGSSMLLLLVARLFDPACRPWAYAAAAVGLAGSLAGFIALHPFETDLSETMGSFFGATATAMAVLALMNLSGFKAR